MRMGGRQISSSSDVFRYLDQRLGQSAEARGGIAEMTTIRNLEIHISTCAHTHIYIYTDIYSIYIYSIYIYSVLVSYYMCVVCCVICILCYMYTMLYEYYVICMLYTRCMICLHIYTHVAGKHADVCKN